MPDYKEMYLTMVRASEQALRHTEEAARVLIEAQRRCEELYLAEEPPALLLRRGEGKDRDDRT
ncbi:MAG: hypothetical protein ACI3WR_08560 [Oscillospiraceae bacterium]